MRKAATHPYVTYEGSPLWKSVDGALRALVKNGDIIEQTGREYIVGAICNAIAGSSLKRSPR